MFSKALILFLAFCGIAAEDFSPYKECDSLPSPRNLFIENCEFFPCPIYTGFNVNAQWDFIATNEISRLKPVAKWSLGPALFIVPYPLGIKNGCNNLVENTKCPLQQNDVGTFQLSFPVPSIARPGVSVWIQFSLEDQNGDVQSCFITHFAVKEGH